MNHSVRLGPEIYEIAARIDDDVQDAVGCFDPTRIVVRIRDEIPGITVCIYDYAWANYDYFASRAEYTGALRVAENDARRRGPIFIFRVRTENDQIIKGAAERYRVHINSEQPIPEPIKSQFLTLFNSFNLGDTSVRSVKIVGNSFEDA